METTELMHYLALTTCRVALTNAQLEAFTKDFQELSFSSIEDY